MANSNAVELENGSMGLRISQNENTENYQVDKLEIEEETKPGVTFVDPAGDRYDPKSQIE